MRKRRWELVGSVLGLFTVAAMAAWWWAARPFPCYATFSRVRTGMTLNEVIATVGGPPGWYARRFVEKDYGIVMPSSAGDIPPHILQTITSKLWVADDAQLAIYFDSKGRVWRTWVFDGLYRLEKDGSQNSDE